MPFTTNAPMIAPMSDMRPPTAAQITMVTLNETSSAVGETYCTIITHRTPATAATKPDSVKTDT